jgi:hypothetical protein
MADGKIGVGATIGIVVGITAVVGLGIYFIIKSKTPKVQPAYVPPPTNNNELEALKTQLEILKQQNANAKANSLSEQQKAANQAQIEGIAIALGGKLVTAGIDSWLKGWNKSGRYNLDTTPVTYESDFVSRDYSTPLTLSSDLPLWARS